MKAETKDKVLKILNTSDNTEIVKEVTEAIILDPMMELKKTFYDFFKRRLEKIEDQEEFKLLVQKALITKIDKDKVKFKDLIELFRIIYSETTANMDTLLSIFKNPQNGTMSSILTSGNIQNDVSEANSTKMFNSMSAEELQKVDKLWRVIKALASKSNEKDVNNNINNE